MQICLAQEPLLENQAIRETKEKIGGGDSEDRAYAPAPQRNFWMDDGAGPCTRFFCSTAYVAGGAFVVRDCAKTTAPLICVTQKTHTSGGRSKSCHRWPV